MRKLIGILLLSLSIITLIACSKNNYQSLDGEYYLISSERNELAFTIKGDNASIEHGEADSFTINKQKNTIELTGKILQVEQKNIHLKMGSFLLTLVELSTTTILKIAKHIITL